MCRGLVALMLVLGSALGARAGVYRTIDPDPYPLPSEPKAYLDRVNEVGTLSRWDERAKALQADMGSTPTVEQRLNLSACYILQAKFTEALLELKEAEKVAPDNPFVLGNLATAYQGIQEYARAAFKLQQALKVWPRSWAGFTQGQLYWWRRVEQFQLEWLRALGRDQQRMPPVATEPIPGLFSGVKLYEARGDYLVGEMSAENREALPPDDLQIVQQVVLWFPHDRDLFWALAEMYNAHGDVPTAARVMKDLNERFKFGTREFMAHRREVLDANESLTRFNKPDVVRRLFRLTEQPGVDLGQTTYELARQESPPDPQPQAATTSPAAAVRFEGWQPVAVAFIAGLVIGALIIFQVLEFRRWRAARRQPARVP